MREALLKTTRRLAEIGLNKGTSGNVSVRDGNGFLITPSGVEAHELLPQSMVAMQLDGSFEAGKKPSSEWRFHSDILQNRPNINAIVHTHSMFATTLACLQREVPAFHYMIAITGGDSIRCAPYALFGTQALSDLALDALEHRKACLLAHHGMIALGRDLEDALAVAVEVENLCEQYWRILQIEAQPKTLSQSQMQEVFQQFKGYGNWSK